MAQLWEGHRDQVAEVTPTIWAGWAGTGEPSQPSTVAPACCPHPCPPLTLLLASQSISQLVEGSHCQPKPGQRKRLARPSSPPEQEGTYRAVSPGDRDGCSLIEQREGPGCARGTGPARPQEPHSTVLPSYILSKQSLLLIPVLIAVSTPIPISVPVLCRHHKSPERRTRRVPSWSRSVRLLANTLNFSAQASRSSFTPTTGAEGR